MIWFNTLKEEQPHVTEMSNPLNHITNQCDIIHDHCCMYDYKDYHFS